LGVGIYGLTLNPWMAIGIGVVVWIFGSLVQIMALEKYDRVSETT
jgi:type IV secretory pathway TrbD component